MLVENLRRDIVEQNIYRYYIFVGTDTGRIAKYLEDIQSAVNLIPIYLDTVKDAIEQLARPWLHRTGRCLVVRGDEGFVKDEKAWKLINAHLQAVEDCVLILIYPALDKRSKFYKQNARWICVFESMSPEQMSAQINSWLSGMTAESRLTLVKMCGSDYGHTLLECNKVAHYVASHARATNQQALDYLIQTHAIVGRVGGITFDFVDAVVTRNVSATFTYLPQLRQVAISEVGILAILYTGFRHMLMVQGLGKDQRNATQRTGLTPWQVKQAKQKQGAYKIPQLVNALHVIHTADKWIKTGQLDAEIAVDYAVIKILKGV